MTKEEDKWAAQWRNRMQGHSEPLPDGLWERIERDLSAPKVVPLWRTRKFAAAAAAVLLLSSASLWFFRSRQAEYVKQESTVAQRLYQEAKPADVPAEQESDAPASSVKSHVVAEASLAVWHTVASPLSIPAEAKTASTPEYKAEEKEATPTQEAGSLDAKQEKRAESRRRMVADRRTMKQNQQLAEASSGKKKSPAWTIGIAAGNTPYSSSGSTGVENMSSRSLLQSDAIVGEINSGQVLSQKYVSEDTQAEAHHKMPVSVGASFTYGLTDKWALETGLYYTYLASELDLKNYAQEKVNQKLHYIGIPLKVHRSLWKNRWLSVYTSAGAMVEKCVKATQDITSINDRYRDLMLSGALFGATSGLGNVLPTRNLDTDGLRYSASDDLQTEHVSVTTRPWQLSVQWAAGAQVRLSRNFGLYVEPGVAYYFDDRSRLYTVRKEHPFQFTVQMGVRFRLLK